MKIMRDQDGIRQARLVAQIHAIRFCEALGFAAVGPVYDDAGIPHQDMIADLWSVIS